MCFGHQCLTSSRIRGDFMDAGFTPQEVRKNPNFLLHYHTNLPKNNPTQEVIFLLQLKTTRVIFPSQKIHRIPHITKLGKENEQEFKNEMEHRSSEKSEN